MKTSGILVKILSLALVLCMVLSFASCEMIKNLFGGSLKLESFAVDRSTVKTTYYEGEKIDFSGIKAYVKYSDEALNKELVFADLKVSYPDDITATAGQKQVTVTYDDPNLDTVHEAKVDIVVTEDPNKVVHDHYEVDATDVDTTYYIGETVDLTGLKLYDVMSNKTKTEITDLTGLTCDVSTLTATAGNKEVEFTYNGEPAGSVTFRVIDPEEEKNHVLDVKVGNLCQTVYEVGSTLDLTGLSLIVTYEEGEPQTVTTVFTAGSVDMYTTGSKTVKINFLDPINNEPEYVNITISVVKRERVMQFQQPDSISAFKQDNATATQDPTALGFSSHFSVGGQTYVIGDDNNFKYVPTMVAMVDGALVPRTSYYMDIQIEVDLGSGYVRLDRKANNETEHVYSLGNETLATVDSYNGLYKFAKPLAKVRITVLPSAANYTGDPAKTPVVLEATVIDAFNVHDAKQLSVVDNDTYRTDWEALKTEWGLKGIDPAGIVLHNDIKVTYKDVPASFFYDAEHTVQYYNTATGEVRDYASIAGMKYLKDWTYVYTHTGLSDFVVEGNFFQIDAGDFPLVASTSIFEDVEKTYKSDYSNAALFMFEAYEQDVYGSWAQWTTELAEEAIPDIVFKNVALNGNAGRDCWVIQNVDGNAIGTDGELVTAGGLILAHVARYARATFDNVVNKCFFLSYNPAYHGDLNLNNVKAYDSYQTAIYAWGDCIVNVNNTFMNGTGGPVIMAQSVKRDLGGYYAGEAYYNPIITVTGVGNVVTALSGQEAWFKSVDPTGTVVSNITALGGGLNQFMTAVKGTKCNWVSSDSMMNMKVLLMPDGTSAAAALSDIYAQGTVKIGEGGIERWRDGDTFWADIWAFIAANPSAGGAPFVTVKGSDGNYYTMCYNGSFVDLQGNAVTPGTHSDLLNAFAQADEIILSQGGMSMLFELYH